MNTIRVSATKARNNFFELLNQVVMGREVIIKKDSEEVAVLAPKRTKTNWEAFRKAAKKTHGILKHYSAEEIAPVSQKKLWKGFGEWDKDINIYKKK